MVLWNVGRCRPSARIGWYSQPQHTRGCARYQLLALSSHLITLELDPVNISLSPPGSMLGFVDTGHWRCRDDPNGRTRFSSDSHMLSFSKQIGKRKISSQNGKFLCHVTSGFYTPPAPPLWGLALSLAVCVWQPYSLQQEIHLGLGWWWGSYLLNS